ncbi:MAG: BatA domain-containing protein, partial [Bacteroidota bacterium]
MFRFEHIEHLIALGIIPVLVVFFLLTWFARKKALARLGEMNLIERLMPDRSRYKHPLKFGLLMLAMGLLVLGWANPQWGTKKEKVSRKSV